jgi:hypothetical protein
LTGGLVLSHRSCDPSRATRANTDSSGSLGVSEGSGHICTDVSHRGAARSCQRTPGWRPSALQGANACTLTPLRAPDILAPTGQPCVAPVHAHASRGSSDAYSCLHQTSHQEWPAGSHPLPRQATTPHPPRSRFQLGGASWRRLISHNGMRLSDGRPGLSWQTNTIKAYGRELEHL